MVSASEANLLRPNTPAHAARAITPAPSRMYTTPEAMPGTRCRPEQTCMSPCSTVCVRGLRLLRLRPSDGCLTGRSLSYCVTHNHAIIPCRRTLSQDFKTLTNPSALPVWRKAVRRFRKPAIVHVWHGASSEGNRGRPCLVWTMPRSGPSGESLRRPSWEPGSP